MVHLITPFNFVCQFLSKLLTSEVSELCRSCTAIRSTNESCRNLNRTLLEAKKILIRLNPVRRTNCFSAIDDNIHAGSCIVQGDQRGGKLFLRSINDGGG